jgi:hypothetical protein
MESHNNDGTVEQGKEERSDAVFDFWSDEGAKIFNEILDEGSAYISMGAHVCEDCETFGEGKECDYLDPDLYDPDEETLPPGEMEMIWENSYVN